MMLKLVRGVDACVERGSRERGANVGGRGVDMDTRKVKTSEHHFFLFYLNRAETYSRENK